jgi:hypothetical protein
VERQILDEGDRPLTETIMHAIARSVGIGRATLHRHLKVPSGDL